jgi:hypothetical protein
MKRLLLFAVLIAAAGSSAMAATGPLDGKTFSGKVLMEGDKNPDADQLIFKDGTFRSTSCDEFGYPAATYSAESASDGMHFKATAKNEKGATMTWNGVISGDKAKASAQMVANDGSKTNFNFEGSASTIK